MARKLVSISALAILALVGRGGGDSAVGGEVTQQGKVLLAVAGSTYRGVADLQAASVQKLAPADLGGTTPLYLTWRASAWNRSRVATNIREVGTDTFVTYAIPALRREHGFRLHELVDRVFGQRYFGDTYRDFALSANGLIAAVWDNEAQDKVYVSVIDPAAPRLVSNHLIYEGAASTAAGSGARVAWFSDGKRLLISTHRNMKLVYVVKAGQDRGYDTITLRGLPDRAISIDSLEVSPDDTRVAMSVSVRYAGTDTTHKEIFTLDLTSGATRQLTAIPASARGGRRRIRHNHPVWSPDGQRLLFSFHSNVQSLSPTEQDLVNVFSTGAPGACSPLVVIPASIGNGAVKGFGPGQPLARQDILHLTSSPDSYLVGCDEPLGWMR